MLKIMANSVETDKIDEIAKSLDPDQTAENGK